MNDDLDFLTVIVGIIVSSYVAIAVSYVAQVELGWSSHDIARWAFAGILLMSIVALSTALRPADAGEGG